MDSLGIEPRASRMLSGCGDVVVDVVDAVDVADL